MIDLSNKMFDVIKQDLAVLEDEMLAAVESPVALITEIGTHLVKSGGKRIRPALYFLAVCCGSFRQERAMPLAVAIEMIHMASLVHDDVIDSADTRRGTPTANAKWGNQLSILSGDYLFAKAFSLVAGNHYDERVTTRLADLVCGLSSGEIIQNKEIYKASRDVEEYYERIAKKTADFLEICCELGGIVGEVDAPVIDALRVYGASIGMAFQITDDLLDLTADAATIGKPAGNDILQGIVTLPVIRALNTSPDSAELERIVTNRSMTAAELARALDIVKASDGLEFAQAKVDEYLAKARAVLPASLPADVREAYIMAADFIGGRKF